MIEKVIPKIRNFFEPPEAKVKIRSRDESSQHNWGLTTVNRFEPIIADKHFGDGYNLVDVELEAGGDCRIMIRQKQESITEHGLEEER